MSKLRDLWNRLLGIGPVEAPPAPAVEAPKKVRKPRTTDKVKTPTKSTTTKKPTKNTKKK